MAPTAEVADLQTELRSIGRLIDDLLQRQALLSSRLKSLEHRDSEWPPLPEAVTTSSDAPGPSSTPSWSCVAKGNRKVGLPLYDSFSANDISLSNFFSPLSRLPTGPSASSSSPPARRAPRVRKRPSPSGVSSPEDSSLSSSAPPESKRARFLPHRPQNYPPVALNEALSSPSSDHHPAAGVTPVHPAPPYLVSTSCDHKLNLKLAVYKSTPDVTHPELLILGDSIVCFLALPGAITYCLSGGKTSDLIELIPTLLDIHPTVHTVIAHSGCNDVMSRQSSKLHRDLESLCCTVESLGKRCIISGPIPNASRNSERFSRLYSLHQWLQGFCSATGLDYIANFDSFWSNTSMYKADGVHLNKRGTKLLTKNAINYIAFNIKQ